MIQREVSEEGRLHAQENFLLSSVEAWSESILLTSKAAELVVWFHLYNKHEFTCCN